MNWDHITGAVAAYAGAFTAQLLVNRRVRAFIQEHLDTIYKALNEVRAKLDLSPIPFRDTDLGPEPVSGSFRIK